MEQEVKYLNIDDLVLWTENPRDSISPDSKDQDVVDRAILNDPKWTLRKLAREMGDFYDLSELPTVVYHRGKPVVYDGNRRMILAKIQHGCVSVDEELIGIPSIPAKIPCNVCTEEIALINVYRKHGNSGTWSPLDRDIFLHKFMKKEKSIFLELDDNTGLISANPHLNQGFVKKELFTSDKLAELGIEFHEGQMLSKHTSKETRAIFDDISNKVALGNISTRGANRGKIIPALERTTRDIIEKNSSKKPQTSKLHFDPKPEPKKEPRVSPRTKQKSLEIFNGKLYLKSGSVNNLHRDIEDLYKFYASNKNNLSSSFPSLIRMSLRLLCESAAKETDFKNMEPYVNKYFPLAKKNFDADMKTTLSNHNVKENTMVQLLHTGAHNYEAANNIDVTLAMSVILGGMLTISHGKQ